MKKLTILPNELSKSVPEFGVEDIKLHSPLNLGEWTALGRIYQHLVSLKANDPEKEIYFLGEDHIEILLSCVGQKVAESCSGGYLALWGTALKNDTDHYNMVWTIEHNWENDMWLKSTLRSAVGGDDISKWAENVHYGMLIPYIVK